MTGSRPYREPGREPAPPRSEAERIGPLHSTHVPPSPLRMLGAPLLGVAGFLTSAATGMVPWWLAIVGAAGSVLVFGGPARRAIDRSVVALHARGVIVTNGPKRTAIAFEEVNEVWFEVPWLHAEAGAYLSGMRLVGFDGTTHHMPLGVDGGSTVAVAILRGCSAPLLDEAREALKEGAPLTFGDVQIDRNGVTVHDRRRDWNDVRLAVVSHARLHLYGRWPLFAWRTVRLDHVPNAAVLAGLVARCTERFRFDDPLLLPFGTESGATRTPPHVARALALREVAIGALVCGAGLAITLITKAASARGFYVVAVGPMLYGAFRLVRALLALMSSKR